MDIMDGKDTLANCSLRTEPRDIGVAVSPAVLFRATRLKRGVIDSTDRGWRRLLPRAGVIAEVI
jgi:hypothetical protein